LVELDATAQRLQRESSVFARCGAIELQLAETYPDLEQRSKKEKQAKIDSIVLFNKYGEPDTRGSSSYKAGSFHEHFEASLQLSKSRRKSSVKDTIGSPSPTASPALRGKRSTADLIFEMDGEDHDDDEMEEEEEEESTSPLPSLKERLQAVASSERTTPTKHSKSNPWKLDHGPETSPFNDRSPELPSPLTRPSEAAPSLGAASQPWGAARLSSSKLGLQEIMAQASSTRTSNISLGLSASPSSERKSSGSFKPSQKERKKQQVQQGARSAPLLPTAPQPSSSPASPWQIARPKIDAPSMSQPPALVSPRTPHLTMRQTVANPSSSAKEKSFPPSSTPSQNIQPRKASGPASQPSNSGNRSTSRSISKQSDISGGSLNSTFSKQIPIQSVRHTPQQTSSVSMMDMSMEEILSQQLIEKTAIKDFAAKRSLEEIQQEQEFQEWWDKESARVREEEEMASKSTPTRGEASARGRGGKRRGRGGGGGGGGAAAAARPKGKGKAETSAKPGVDRSSTAKGKSSAPK
jgi:hypothetical protein